MRLTLNELVKIQNDVEFILNGLTSPEQLSILFAAASNSLVSYAKENPKETLQLIEIFCVTLSLAANFCMLELHKVE